MACSTKAARSGVLATPSSDISDTSSLIWQAVAAKLPPLALICTPSSSPIDCNAASIFSPIFVAVSLFMFGLLFGLRDNGGCHVQRVASIH